MTFKRKLITIIIIILSLLLVLIASFATYSYIHGKQDSYMNVDVSKAKTTYYIGEEFDNKNITVEAFKFNGDTYEISVEDCTFSGFDSSKAVEQQKITVTYKTISSYYFIEVKNLPTYNKTPKSISFVTYPKLNYTWEEYSYHLLDIEGATLQITYTDDSNEIIPLKEEYLYFKDKINKPGTYTIDVKYRQSGVIVTTDFTITITE